MRIVHLGRVKDYRQWEIKILISEILQIHVQVHTYIKGIGFEIVPCATFPKDSSDGNLWWYLTAGVNILFGGIEIGIGSADSDAEFFLRNDFSSGDFIE